MKKYSFLKIIVAIFVTMVLFALLSFTEYLHIKHLMEPSHPAMKETATVEDSLPDDFPEITVNVNNNPSNGFIFLSNFPLSANVEYTPYLMILKPDGTPYFYRKMEAGLNLDFKLQPNGVYTYYDFDKKKFYALDTATFAVVDSFACSSNYTGDEHELRILPNGNYLLLANDIRKVNMALIVPGGKPNASVINFVIQEITPEGEVVFEWNTFDHFEITDAVEGIDLTGFVVDYVHCNAIEVDYDGNLLLSSRYFDEITKIDRTTGEIIWRMGGKLCKNNQFRFINDSTADFFGFSHQHAIRRLPNGHITLMDNGNMKDPPFSRAVEYELDEENKTATLVWQFRHNPDIYDNSMGYVQRLDNGNTLIGWGENENAVAATEVTPDGEVVYELSLPEKQYSYRAFKFNILRTGMNEHPAPETAHTEIDNIYPNPFRNSVNISYTVKKEEDLAVYVYDLNGKPVRKLVNRRHKPGTYSVTWDGRDDQGRRKPAGIYTVTLNKYHQKVVSKRVFLTY